MLMWFSWKLYWRLFCPLQKFSNSNKFNGINPNLKFKPWSYSTMAWAKKSREKSHEKCPNKSNKTKCTESCPMWGEHIPCENWQSFCSNLYECVCPCCRHMHFPIEWSGFVKWCTWNFKYCLLFEWATATQFRGGKVSSKIIMDRALCSSIW